MPVCCAASVARCSSELRHRFLRAGGSLILGTPDYSQPLWWILEWIYGMVLPGAYAQEHITHYTRDSLAARLGHHGYTIESIRYVGFCEMIFPDAILRSNFCETSPTTKPNRPALRARCALPRAKW